MKSKKIILTILSVVLILALTTVSFAAKTGMTFDEAVEASKEREKATNEVVNEEEKKVVEETENTVEEPVEEEASKDEKEENSEKVEKEETEEKTEEGSEEIEEEGVVTFLDTISSDIVVGGENIEYKSTYVDGNVHIMAEKVVLKDFKVDGNLFICSTNTELDNVLVDGSCYIIGETIKVDGQMDSAYLLGENITVTAFANIEKELRVAATALTFEGSVGRDLAVYAENVTISDRAKVFGDCFVEAASVDVSEDAKINGEKTITIVENTNNFSISNQYVYNTIIANCVIVLVIAIFVLYSSPKFVAVNGKLRLRDFIKALFTGILELVLVVAIFVGLSYVGYGIGFGLALLLLSLIFVYFGKTIFIISAGIRLAGKSENVSKVKSFFLILIVLAVVEAVNLLQLLGVSGLLASMIINLVLGIIGFGSFVRVVLAPTRKAKVPVVVQNNSNNNIREAKPEDFVMKGAPIKEETIVEEVKDDKIEEIKEEPKSQKEVKEKKVKVKENEEKVEKKDENVEKKDENVENKEEKNKDKKVKGESVKEEGNDDEKFKEENSEEK